MFENKRLGIGLALYIARLHSFHDGDMSGRLLAGLDQGSSIPAVLNLRKKRRVRSHSFSRLLHPFPIMRAVAEQGSQQAQHALCFGPKANGIAGLDDADAGAPAQARVGDGVPQQGGNGGLEAEQASPGRVLADALERAQGAEALAAAEAAVAAAPDAAEGQAADVEAAKVVDGDHAGAEGAHAPAHVGAGVAEDRGAERVGGAVGEVDGVGDRGGAHEHADGREELRVRDRHGRRHVAEERGFEVVAVRVVGVGVAAAAAVQGRAGGDGRGDEGLEAREGARRDHGAEVDGLGGRGGAEAEGGDFVVQECEEAVVDVGQADDSFYADAILAVGLEGPAEDDAGDVVEVSVRAGVVEHDCRVFAAQFHGDGRQALARARAYLVCHFSAADKRDVAQARVACQIPCCLGQADQVLDEVRTVSTCPQRASYNVEVVESAPTCLFGRLDHDGISGEQCGDDGRDEIVKWVVPRHGCRHHSQRFVVYNVGFVTHQEVGRPT